YGIANQHLVVPARLKDLIPVAGGRVGRNQVAVECDHCRGTVHRPVEAVGAHTAGIHRGAPGRVGGLQHTLGHATVEDGGGTTKPDVGNRVGILEPEPVENFLAAHVEPTHVDVGMGSLEGL